MKASLLYSITILFFLATVIFAAPTGKDQSDSHNYIKFIKPNKSTVWKVGENVSIEIQTAGVKESKSTIEFKIYPNKRSAMPIITSPSTTKDVLRDVKDNGWLSPPGNGKGTVSWVISEYFGTGEYRLECKTTGHGGRMIQALSEPFTIENPRDPFPTTDSDSNSSTSVSATLPDIKDRDGKADEEWEPMTDGEADDVVIEDDFVVVN